MSILVHLESLADLFPTYPRSELASRLLCADNVQTVIEELFAEQQQPPAPVYGADVRSLKDMFPSKPMSELAAALQRNKNDLETTIDCLMEVDLPSQLAALSGLSADDARPYAARNRTLLRALADAIANHKKTTKAWTSRVQGRQSITVKPAYVFDPNSAAAQELDDCIASDTALQRLNYDFLVKSLVFFEGNVPQVLTVAARFLEDNEHALTFDTKLGYTHRVAPAQISMASAQKSPSLPLSFAQVAKAPVPDPNWRSASNSPKPLSTASSLLARSAAVPKISTLGETTTVDLHGYLVSEAVDIAAAAAARWWAEEAALRVEDGHLEKHARIAHFVEPLTIITGRGLHSAGGVARIRPAVIRKLRGLGYIIEEESSKVTVKGKRA